MNNQAIKKIIVLIILLLIIFAGIFFIRYYLLPEAKISDNEHKMSTNSMSVDKSKVVAQNLNIPWALALLPDGGILVTERKGSIRYINPSGQLRKDPLIQIQDVEETGEGGLLGITLHPNFETNKYVYVYYTYHQNGNNILNKISRLEYRNESLINVKTILDAIPGASNHDGGRIKFGPDNFLYIGTGDAQEPSNAQNKNSLAGKILRVTDEGDPAPGNPFNNEVYSYGHRNVQGLAWDENGNLWATEHGRSGIQSGLDELNLIEAGKNYGWPEIEGDETRSGMEKPKLSSEGVTWAPSGATIIGNSLFFAGLRGSTLYEAIIKDGNIVEFNEYFTNEFGRLREVIAGKNNSLYITSSNTDGRGIPDKSDDKVIQINVNEIR